MFEYAIISAAVGGSLIWAGIKAFSYGNLRDSRFMAVIGLCSCGASVAMLLAPA